MKTNVIVCVVSFIVGAATVAALDRVYLTAPDRFEFRQMKRASIEILYRVNKTTGDVEYVASTADPEKIGPTPKDNGEWWKNDPRATASGPRLVGSVDEVFKDDPELSTWLKRELPKLSGTK